MKFRDSMNDYILDMYNISDMIFMLLLSLLVACIIIHQKKKSYPFTNNFRGEIKPGEPLHDMWIRLTVDTKFIVQDVEVHTDAGPYQLCPSILPNFQKLKGLKIGPGWNRRVREKLSGVHGCAHLVDMLKPLATVALHTIQFSNSAPGQGGKQEKTPRPPIDTCHVWSSDGEMIRRRYPDYYTGDKP